MLKSKKKFNMDRYWWTGLFVILIIVGYTIIGVNIENGSKRFYNETIHNLDSGWTADSGDLVALSTLPHGTITVQRSVEDVDFSNKRLCMKSVDTFFEVSADGKIIYSYYPEQEDILGVSYGMYIHEIPIPENTKILTLKLIPIFSKNPATLINTMVVDPGMFMGDLFKEGIPGFCVCLLMLFFGIILIVVSILTAREAGGQQIEFFSLGVFSILIAAWSVNDTMILQVLTQSPAIIRMINYVTLIFLPYFPVSFIAGAVNNKKTKFRPFMLLLICANFIINITLSSMKISDYFDLVVISHIVIIIALCICVYLVISAIRNKDIERKFLVTLIVGMAVAIFGAVLDLVRFRMNSGMNQGASLYTCMGTFIFLVLIGLYFIKEYNRVRIEKSQAEVTARLAYLDGLTGLKNRRAFNEQEASLQDDPEKKCIILQFDINDMKKVNDVFGHMEGDRHIIAAAKAIRENFGKLGECYRTGGDEFMTIITENVDEEKAQDALSRMEKYIEEYNSSEKPPVALEIAYGMAMYQPSGESLKKIQQLADQRMYECKHRKKNKG